MNPLRYLWLTIFLWCIVQSIFLVWNTHDTPSDSGYSKLRRKYLSRLLLFGAFTIRSFLPPGLRGDGLHRDIQQFWNYLLPLLAITWLHFDNVFILHSTAYTWRRLWCETRSKVTAAGVAVVYFVGLAVERIQRHLRNSR